MKRDIKELIPLIAIGLMIIGAIIILVAMNSSDDTKNNKENTLIENNTNKIKIPDEESTPVTSVDDNKLEVSKPVSSADNNTENVTENNTTNQDDNSSTGFEILDSNTQVVEKESTSSRRDYIEDMVNDFLGGTAGKSNKESNETAGTTTNTNVTVNNTSTTVSSSNTNNSHSIVSKPITNTVKTNKTTIVTYNNLDKSVAVGNYVVSTTTDNKIISAKSGSKNVALSVLDSGDVSILQARESFVYAYEIGGGLKKYTLVGGKLKLVSKAYFAIEAIDMAITGKYVFIVTTNGLLYAFEEKESTFVQMGTTREYDSIIGISNVNSPESLTVETTNSTYTYTFDGINFYR